MHLKRMIAINVELQCRLASCNCALNSPKETYNEFTYQNGVRSTAQILVFKFMRKLAVSVSRICSIRMRAEMSLKFELNRTALLSRVRGGQKEKQFLSFFIITVRDYEN